MRIMLCIGLLCLTSSAFAAVPDEVVDISGAVSVQEQGSANNQILNVNLTNGSDYLLTGVGWDVIYQTVSPSWASEARIGISDSNGLITTLGGWGGDSSGTFFSAGQSTFSTVLVSGGVLSLEFYETFVDFSGSPDGTYLSPSTLVFKGQKVPEPASLGLMLAGLGLVCFRRRR